MLLSKILKTSSLVKAALADGRPVVALESTVIAHGLPRPLNLKVAFRLEQIVSEAGAVPATIAILNGQLRAGLDDAEIELIAQDDNIRKVSTRDLPLAVGGRWNGATTVATTAWIAHRAGIKVFATGGIGGVHRDELPDISADLPELARTPIVVVCSGAKIVLNLPATREWLETHGITVVGYQCDELPAFYSRVSGLPIDARVDSPADVAEIVKARRELGFMSALLVTVPVPVEMEVPAEKLQRTLEAALIEAETTGIGGRELTPFLLRRMAETSDGATLRANVALLENNARVAAAIACAL
ncbi:MAG TPA: pseudouridine-5'-phosphate glycosidase [Pyrinomonadaceae bacterium]|nr:pseudouridine-5'-phosphate glycosidase [Pyrinomonadaceae bacterium]